VVVKAGVVVKVVVPANVVSKVNAANVVVKANVANVVVKANVANVVVKVNVARAPFTRSWRFWTPTMTASCPPPKSRTLPQL
jgi:hypothetical protein